MIADITTAVSGIIEAITSIIMPNVSSGTNSAAVAYAALLALPILGGSVAFARRLVKKSR